MPSDKAARLLGHEAVLLGGEAAPVLGAESDLVLPLVFRFLLFLSSADATSLAEGTLQVLWSMQ